MKDRMIEDIVSITRTLVNEDYSDWDDETENVYHELNSDEQSRREMEQHQQSNDYDKFRDFAEKKLKEKGYNDNDINEIDWSTVYNGESNMMESKELNEEHEFDHEEELDSMTYIPNDHDTFYVRMEHEGYSWGAEYSKSSPESPFEGHGEWEPVGSVTQEKPHPDFYRVKVTAKASPERVVEILRETFDFVGEPTNDPDVAPTQETGEMFEETDISYRGLVDDLESIMASCETKSLMENHAASDNYDSVEENLYLYIVNSGDIYQQFTDPIIQNLRKKVDMGIYSKNKAISHWLKVADEGAKRYFNEIGNEEGEELTWHSMFPPKVRNNVARDLADYYSQLIFEDGMMENKKSKKKKKKKFVGNSDDRDGLDENQEIKDFIGVIENMEYGDQDDNGKLERIQRLEKEIYGDVMTHDLSELEQSPCDYIAFLHSEENDREIMESVPKPKIRSRD